MNVKIKKIFIIGLIASITVIIGGFLLGFLINKKQGSLSSQIQSSNFKDDELGISFQIPKSWGNAVVKNKFLSPDIFKEISFSNQPNIKLISNTKNAEDEDIENKFYSSADLANAYIKSFCKAQYDDSLGSGELKTIKPDGQDVFRGSGKYSFGDCVANPPFLNIAKKISKSIAWFPIDNSEISTSTIKLSKNFFWGLQNQIYKSLALKMDFPDIKSDEACTKFFSSVLLKSFACINHKEKDLIEASFADFDSTQLSKEINSLVNSLQIYYADKAVSLYENYFKEKVVFSDAGLEISFNYPSVFGQPEFKSNTLSFSNVNSETFFMTIIDITDAAQIEKEAADECEKNLEEGSRCFGPLITQKIWKRDRDVLAQSDLRQIQCPFSDGYCEIVNINNKKMLIFHERPQSRITEEYVFYVNDKRFSVSTSEYRKLALKLVREIIESIKIKN